MVKYNYRLDLQELQGLYEQGFSCAKIGRIVGATRQAVWEKLKNGGQKMRSQQRLPYIMYDGKKWTLDKHGYYRNTAIRSHHTSLHRYKYNKEVGRIPDGCDIHHIDGDKTNNSLDNLVCIDKGSHARLHVSQQFLSSHTRLSRDSKGRFIK